MNPEGKRKTTWALGLGFCQAWAFTPESEKRIEDKLWDEHGDDLLGLGMNLLGYTWGLVSTSLVLGAPGISRALISIRNEKLRQATLKREFMPDLYKRT